MKRLLLVMSLSILAGCAESYATQPKVAPAQVAPQAAPVVNAFPPGPLGNQVSVSVTGSIPWDGPARNGNWTLTETAGAPPLGGNGGILMACNPRVWTNGSVWLVAGDTSCRSTSTAPMAVIMWQDAAGIDCIRKIWGDANAASLGWEWFEWFHGANFARASVRIQ